MSTIQNTRRIIVGRSRHDLFDQTIKRRDTVAGLATPKDTGAVDIQCGKVGPGAAAIIFVFDVHGAAGAASMCRVLAPARLDRGYDEFIIVQRLISQPRAYRSSDRPAFSANSGSRGKIQLR